MSSLPPGVTDSMLEPLDPACAKCGHASSMHYGEDWNNDVTPLRRSDYDWEDTVQLNADGTVAHACDALVNTFKEKIQCDCDKYIEGEFEPDFDEDWFPKDL